MMNWIKEWFRPKKPWEKKPLGNDIKLGISNAKEEVAASLTKFDIWLQQFNSIALKVVFFPIVVLLLGGFGFFIYALIQSNWETSPPVVSAPLEPEVAQQLLAANLSSKNYPAAWKNLEELRLVWKNDARLYQAEGALHMVDTRDYSLARESFQKALEISPRDPVLNFNLAEAEFNLGNYKKASELYKTVFPDLKDNELIPFRLYVCERIGGESEKAEKLYQKFEPRFQSPSWFYIRIFDAIKEGNMNEVESLRKAAKILHGDKVNVFEKTLQNLELKAK
jgi:tetratricopeptide (TPR) repeat protein